MTQEQKDLLLKDLSGRLPYEVKIFAKYADGYGLDVKEKVGILCQIDTDRVLGLLVDEDEYSITYVSIPEIKPYLFPLSSMTDEEKKEYYNLCIEEEREQLEFGEWVTRVYYHNTIESIDWLNEHHFDYRDLITQGLAIEAKAGNNPYK